MTEPIPTYTVARQCIPSALTENEIFNLLKTGEAIRVLDGRYTDGFVDLQALTWLIEHGYAKVEDRGGMRFAVAASPVKHPGAGRPTRYPAGTKIVHVNIALSQDEVAWLDSQRGTGESRADVVRRLIADAEGLDASRFSSYPRE